jgi:hypothetical protein
MPRIAIHTRDVKGRAEQQSDLLFPRITGNLEESELSLEDVVFSFHDTKCIDMKGNPAPFIVIHDTDLERAAKFMDILAGLADIEVAPVEDSISKEEHQKKTAKDKEDIRQRGLGNCN